MLDCINQALDIFIKLSLIATIAFLTYFYLKIWSLDRTIEKENKKFEEERNSKRGQGRGITEVVINQQIEESRKHKDEKIAPLERRRQAIISKLPFFK